MRRFLVTTALALSTVGLLGTTAGAAPKPHPNKVAMCYQYVPGGWETVYVPSSQVDKRLATGDYNSGECLPA